MKVSLFSCRRGTTKKHLSAASSFTFASRYSGEEVITPLNTLLPGGDYVQQSNDVSAYLSSDIPSTASSKTTAISLLPDTSTPGFYTSDLLLPSTKELTGKNIPAGHPNSATSFGDAGMQNRSYLKMKVTIADRSAELEPVSSEAHHEEADEERSELSYASYENSADRSIPSPNDPRSGRIAPHGPRPPYVAISPREHSFYQSRGHGSRGSDGLLTIIPSAIEGLQHLLNPNIRAANQLSDENTQVFSPPTDTEDQTAGPPAATPNGVIGPTPSESSKFPDAAAPIRSRFSPVVTVGTHLCDIAEDVKDFHPATDLQNLAGTEYIAVDASTHTTFNGPSHIRNGSRGGATPPTVDVRGPTAPPSRRVWTRGAFLIGNSAPVKIDERVEVRLRDGGNGEVDFII